MPKCPDCGCEIDHLLYNEVCEIREYARVKLIWNGLRYDWYDYQHGKTLETSAFSCPKCGYNIADDSVDALKFLKEK